MLKFYSKIEDYTFLAEDVTTLFKFIPNVRIGAMLDRVEADLIRKGFFENKLCKVENKSYFLIPRKFYDREMIIEDVLNRR